jgi:glyoxylase-like metal-dependent hydrolase (beta-lactamase superfamily II)
MLTDEGWVLVNAPAYPDDANFWKEQLLTIADRPFLYLILSDEVRAHSFGSYHFDALIIAHQHTAQAIKGLPQNYVEANIEALDDAVPDTPLSFGSAAVRIPDMTFSDRLHIKRGGCSLTLLSQPGPTPGSIWVQIPEEEMLFIGSTVPVGAPDLSQAASKSWLKSLNLLRRGRFSPYTLAPSFGPFVNQAATEPVSAYIRVARRRVHTLYRAGRSRSDTSSLIQEMVENFPAWHDQEDAQRVLKSGLEHLYEEYKALQESHRDENGA